MHDGKQVLPNIPQKVCERAIGRIIMRATLERPPEIKQNTIPVTLRKVICGLVKLAKEKDGYTLGVEAKGGVFTAFDKISDLMKNWGFRSRRVLFGNITKNISRIDFYFNVRPDFDCLVPKAVIR